MAKIKKLLETRRHRGKLGRTEDSGASGNREKLLYEAKIENLSEPRIGRFWRFGKHLGRSGNWKIWENAKFGRFGKYLNAAKNERCGIANLERYVMLASVGGTQQEKALTGGSNSLVSAPFREKHIDRVEEKNRRIKGIRPSSQNTPFSVTQA